MKEALIIEKLAANQKVFQHLFTNISKSEILWRPHSEHWCLLEILCHLNDNEHEDFKVRIQSVLEDPTIPLVSIEPSSWVTERAYIEQDFEEKLVDFLEKRSDSIHWLKSLSNPLWGNTYNHATFGKLTARNFLVNWLAHDNLHIRQITRIKYLYLKEVGGENLSYAGKW